MILGRTAQDSYDCVCLDPQWMHVRIVISHGFFSKPKAAAGTDDTHTHHYNSLAVSHASQQPWQYHAPSLRSTLRAPTNGGASPHHAHHVKRRRCSSMDVHDGWCAEHQNGSQ